MTPSFTHPLRASARAGTSPPQLRSTPAAPLDRAHPCDALAGLARRASCRWDPPVGAIHVGDAGSTGAAR